MSRTFRKLLRSVLAVALPVGLTAVCAAGCGKTANHYKTVEKGAVRYYREKYSDAVTVEKSYKAGNSGLFGFAGVKDRAYEMSDGVSVYWNDKEEYYADNRQAEEICEALREKIMDPALAQLGENILVSDYTFNRTGMESFDERVFTQLYEGDIRKYSRREKIKLCDFKVALPADDFKEKAETFLDSVSPYLTDCGGMCVVAAEGQEGAMSEELFAHPEGDPAVRALGQLRFGEGVRWLENIYVEVLPGVRFSSGAYDLVLEPGDVIFEEAGIAQDLQKKLDDGYYALPVEAEENKNGGYNVRDQHHESRTVLLNNDSPVYLLKYSDKVKERLDSNGKIFFYVMVDRPEEKCLWYYTNTTPYTYTIFRVAESGKNRGSAAYLAEDMILYLGEAEWEE